MCALRLVTVIAVVLAGGALDHSRATAGLPAVVVFPGSGGIGANFSRYVAPPSDWEIVRSRANVSDRCYLPSAEVELRLETRAATGAAAPTIGGRWVWHWVGDRASDDKGGVALTDLGKESEVPVDATVKAGETWMLRRRAPDRAGVLALFYVPEHGPARWVTNIAVLHAVVEGRRPDSMFLGDTRGTRPEVRATEIATLRKLGVKWVRLGESFAKIAPERDVRRWEILDHEIAAVRAHGMYALFLGGHAPLWMRPHGRIPWPRNNPKKQDSTPSPLHYGDWADLWREVVGRHSDVIRAVNVWNEPWEDGGISDWGSTGEHYRGLQRAAWHGVKQADPTVLVGGNDSDHNINDNLLSDPNWRSYTDLFTVHGFSVNQGFIGRVAPGVPIWNTEAWYTAWSDRTVQWMLFERARGVEKVNVLVLGNFFEAGYVSGGYFKGGRDLVPQPNALAYNTLAHLLEDHRYLEELDAGALPHQFLWERPGTQEHASRAVLVWFGATTEPEENRYWQVQGPAVARLKPFPGLRAVIDRYGQPLALHEGAYDIPFSTEPVYLIGDSAASLRGAKSHVTLSQHPVPLHVAVLDPTERQGHRTALEVQIRNPLPVDQSGTIRLDPASPLQTDAPEKPFRVQAGGIATLRWEIQGHWTSGALMTVRAESQLGRVTRKEMVGPRVIPRVEVDVDGNAQEWVSAGVELRRVGASLEANAAAVAARPWEAASLGPAEGAWALGYDEKHLYVVAKLQQQERGARPWDQTALDWYQLHPAGYAYLRGPQWPFTGENLQLALDLRENPEDALYPPDHPQAERFARRNVDYLFGFFETHDGRPQAWWYRRPGSAWRHRFPFSPARALEQGIPPGVQVAVQRNEATHTTTIEAAIPWSLLPEVDPVSGTRLSGAEVKLTPAGWNGWQSAAGRGAARVEGMVFQPYWTHSYSVDLPWRLGEAGEPGSALSDPRR